MNNNDGVVAFDGSTTKGNALISNTIVTHNNQNGFRQTGTSVFNSLGNNVVRKKSINTFGTITVISGTYAARAVNFMGTKTKTEIIVEKHQRIVIRSRRQTVIAWCEQCSVEVLMLTPEKAALLVQTTAREIYHRVEMGQLHFIETESGALLVCSNSLSIEFSTQQRQKAAGES